MSNLNMMFSGEVSMVSVDANFSFIHTVMNNFINCFKWNERQIAQLMLSVNFDPDIDHKAISYFHLADIPYFKSGVNIEAHASPTRHLITFNFREFNEQDNKPTFMQWNVRWDHIISFKFFTTIPKIFRRKICRWILKQNLKYDDYWTYAITPITE